jgi:hypothetical protein
MIPEERDYIKIKEELVIKDWEKGFDMHTKHNSQVSLIRGWTITLLMAYFGFLTSIKRFEFVFIIPMMLIIAGFLILELFEGIYLVSIGRQLHEVERIFMIRDINQRDVCIDKYQFRNLQLAKRRFTDKILSAVSYIKSYRVIFWYSFFRL